jgi:RHS repeat-associated protein
MKLQRMTESVWFGGRLIREGDWKTVQDSQGSVRWRKNMVTNDPQARNYFPYGQYAQNYTPLQEPNNRQAFGTYYRDKELGLDYADQRYFDSYRGRFITPDPYQASAGPADPGSWNRYTYVGGDPVNFNDPSGLIISTLGGTGITIPFPQLIGGSINIDFSIPASPYTMDAARLAEYAMSTARQAITDALPPPIDGPLTDEQRGQFNTSFYIAQSLLADPECASHFGDQALGKLRGATYKYGVVFVDNQTLETQPNAIAATTVETQTVTINLLNRGFFDVGNAMNTGLDASNFRAFVLLHELGHLTGTLGDDLTNPNLSDTFNVDIMKDCFGSGN